MGLDMYLFALPPSNVKNEDAEEIMYWRKHNALHGWMDNKYRELHPDFKDDFNCIYFRLTPELLDELEAAIKANKLRPTQGFFFGTEEYDPFDEADADLAAIEQAREHIAKGKVVAYYSWW